MSMTINRQLPLPSLNLRQSIPCPQGVKALKAARDRNP